MLGERDLVGRIPGDNPKPLRVDHAFHEADMPLPCTVPTLEDDDCTRSGAGELVSPIEEGTGRESASTLLARASQHGIDEGRTPSRLIVLDVGETAFFVERENTWVMPATGYFGQAQVLLGFSYPFRV